MPAAPPPTPQVQFSNVIPDQQEEMVAVKPIVNEKLLRASLEPKTRVFLISSMGGFWGFSMGAFLGAKHSGLQYLAENAHRLPTTVQGWYFYHKTKNYRMMLGGVKRGMRFAAKTGGMCFMYGAIEAGLDEARGEADVFNSVAAGMTTGTLFSVLTKLTRGSVRYSILFGAMFGLATGGLSDLHKMASNQSPSYVDYLKKKVAQ